MKIVTVIGARPQFIKAAAVSRAFAGFNQIEEIIIHTGQHYDENMSAIFFEEMEIPEPAYNLNINGLNHGAMTGQMLEKIEAVLLKEKPDYLMVYGDTNSTIAGALAAKKLDIKVIHIEAGLRSFNMKMPEEINRILTDRISDILFTPNENAIETLKNEGFYNFNCTIINSGDVMEDSALYYASKSEEKSKILETLGIKIGEYCLATIHRQENTDDLSRITAIVKALNEINKKIPVVLPLHPRTCKKLADYGISIDCTIINPVGYFDMLQLIKNCKLVLTDSGGLQKEAYFFNKYCITLRNETEWTELVENGYNFIAGASFNTIIDIFSLIKDKMFNKSHNFYGGGTASQKIATSLVALQLS